MSRIGEVIRATKETDIYVKINLDGTGESVIDTGIPFMDHMLTLFAKHGFFALEVKAKGDLEIDCHHTMEDLALTLGEAINKALGAKEQIKRYGSAILPMDEALALVALDLSNRPYLVYDVEPPRDYIKELDTALFKEFFQALSVKCGMNLHIKMLSGSEVHHIFECIFKALAKALDAATTKDPRVKGVLSTKGTL
ncbi:imidazoleglycerol-phosphate dehydratase HisB [Lentisphaerota bacterium WC36G]|nr:imidazoleglycerol-phosphate dehydratase HisB [Lentisphaerae bacterium WC36]